MNDLPKGWEWKKLGELAKVKGGFAFKSEKFVKTGIPIIRIGNLFEKQIDLTDAVHYPIEDFEKYKEFEVKNKDILIAMSGATTGKIAIAKNLNQNCLLNQRVGKYSIIDETKIFSKYLYYILIGKNYQTRLWAVAGGCAQPNISSKQLENIEIPFPPLSTQKQIVSILENVEFLKQKREETNNETNTLIQGLFYEMFGKNDYEFQEINQHIVETKSRDPKKQPDISFKYVDISGVDGKLGSIKNYSEILGKDAPSRARRDIKHNDILVSTVRPNLNATAIVQKELDGQICSTGFCIIRCKASLNPLFVYTITRQKQFIDELVSKAKGASYPAVTNNDILKVKIPVPPINLQNQFAETVEKIESIKLKQSDSTSDINNLFDALMQKAFNGELIK